MQMLPEICSCFSTVPAEEVKQMTCSIPGLPYPITPDGAGSMFCTDTVPSPPTMATKKPTQNPTHSPPTSYKP